MSNKFHLFSHFLQKKNQKKNQQIKPDVPR